MGVCTLSAGKSVFQQVPRIQRAVVNHQHLPSACCLGWDIVLVTTKGYSARRDHQIHSAALGFKMQPACLLFLQVPQGGLPNPKAASRRCEAHFFFTPLLLYTPTRGPIYTIQWTRQPQIYLLFKFQWEPGPYPVSGWGDVSLHFYFHICRAFNY